jgi:hypothetical protein
MSFDEKYRKLHQTGSDRISSAVNDRPVRPKLKWAFFVDFLRKVAKLPQTGSDPISPTVND